MRRAIRTPGRARSSVPPFRRWSAGDRLFPGRGHGADGGADGSVRRCLASPGPAAGCVQPGHGGHSGDVAVTRPPVPGLLAGVSRRAAIIGCATGFLVRCRRRLRHRPAGRRRQSRLRRAATTERGLEPTRIQPPVGDSVASHTEETEHGTRSPRIPAPLRPNGRGDGLRWGFGPRPTDPSPRTPRRRRRCRSSTRTSTSGTSRSSTCPGSSRPGRSTGAS